MKRFLHCLPLLLLLFTAMPCAMPHVAFADAPTAASSNTSQALDARDSAFSAHEGTWFNWIARKVFMNGQPLQQEANGQAEELKYGVYYDYLIVSVLLMAVVGLVFFLGARKASVRPGDKPTSLASLVEAGAEGFHQYCVSVMGAELAEKYSPLVSSFFFTILFLNWVGLIPGLIAPTSNPNVPFGLAIVGFFCVHFIAIREAGFKSYVMHYVGEPLWLAPLNIPLHIIAELVKPVSLAMRLLGNIFGDETVIAQLALLGIAASAALHLPPVIAVQFPMMAMGTFMGLLQAVVFATLLAIYIVIFAEHHDEHDEHNVHGSTEEVRVYGHEEIIAHPSETTLA